MAEGLEGAGAEHELSDYLRVVLRRRWVVFWAIVVVVGTAVAAAKLQTPVYRATAKVLIQEQTTNPIFDSSSGTPIDPARVVQTQIEVLQSQPVRDAVKRALGTTPSMSATASGGTDVIDVSSDSTNPRRATLVANTYAHAFVDFRRTQAVNDLLATVDKKVDRDEGRDRIKDTIQRARAELSRVYTLAESGAPRSVSGPGSGAGLGSWRGRS